MAKAVFKGEAPHHLDRRHDNPEVVVKDDPAVKPVPPPSKGAPVQPHVEALRKSRAAEAKAKAADSGEVAG